MKSSYLLVTNIWNEKEKIPGFIQNVTKQTHPPKIWLWIDDGSTDNSSTIIRDQSQTTTIPIEIHSLPPKSKGNLDTLGVAYNKVLPMLKSCIDVEYMAIVDVDTKLNPDYFERVCEFMDNHPNVGACAGQVHSEERTGGPMGLGKVVRLDVIKRIDQFWNLAPDSFLNIKAMSMGYIIVTLNNLLIDALPSALFTAKGHFRLGRRAYYGYTHPILVLIKAISLLLKQEHASEYLRGYFQEWSRGIWRFDDKDVKYYYGLEFRTRRWIAKLFGITRHRWSGSILEHQARYLI